jgi:hypothetical protein
LIAGIAGSNPAEGMGVGLDLIDGKSLVEFCDD